MDINLEDKGFCIFGDRGSGKSHLLHTLAIKYGAYALVYDTLHEYPETGKFDIYRPVNRNDPDELSTVTRLVMKSGKYRLFLIDEANRFCKTKPNELPQAIADLNDWQRHYHLAAGFVARRPVQLHQDITELASYLFIFNLGGKNDIAYLNDIKDGLGDAVCQLPKWHYIVVNPTREFEIYKPLPPIHAQIKQNPTTLL